MSDLHDGKDDISLVSDILERRRSDHDNHKVEDPVGRRGQRVGRGSNSQRHNLSWVQPGHTQPTDGEEGVEDKEEDSLRDTGVGVIEVFQAVVRSCEDSHRDGHSGSLTALVYRVEYEETYTKEHERAASHFLDDENGNERGHQVLGSVAGSHQLGSVSATKTNIRVDVGRLHMSAKSRLAGGTYIVGDQVDARNLLEHLVDVGESNTVEFAVLGHVKQTAERALVHFGDGLANGLHFVLNVRVIARFQVQQLQNLDSLFLAPLHDKPSGRLGEVQNRGEDGHGKDNLECNREAP